MGGRITIDSDRPECTPWETSPVTYRMAPNSVWPFVILAGDYPLLRIHFLVGLSDTADMIEPHLV